jgi:hypothetical protein
VSTGFEDLANGVLPRAPLLEVLHGDFHPPVLERPIGLEVGYDVELPEPRDVTGLHHLQMGHLVPQVAPLLLPPLPLDQLERVQHVRQRIVADRMTLSTQASGKAFLIPFSPFSCATDPVFRGVGGVRESGNRLCLWQMSPG